MKSNHAIRGAAGGVGSSPSRQLAVAGRPSSPQPGRSLSPRQLGLALGVSESTVKRWIDAGRLPAQVTSGGHRRVALLPALRFIRRAHRDLADPALLGLTDPTSPAITEPGALAGRIFEHLSGGRRDELQRDLLAVLATGILEPAELFDGPVRAALRRIGELWRGSHQGIYVEHRATQVLLSVLDDLSALVEPPDDAPTAVGGSLSGDPSSIPSRMAAIVLRQQGLRAVDLGASLPAAALLEAADELRARLVWLSVSYVDDARRQAEDVERLITGLAARGVACVLGGREIDRLALDSRGRARVGRSMSDLATIGARIVRREAE